MNRVLLLLLSCAFFFTNPVMAQTDSTTMCGVTNPVQELDWLIDLIQTERPSKIETYTYDSSKVFVIYDTNFDVTLEADTYNCEGELLCIFRGIIDPFNFPTEPFCPNINTNFSDMEVIYTCSCPGSYAPVCGSNGVSYINSCFADCAGVTYTDGQCTEEPIEEPVDTTNTTDPIEEPIDTVTTTDPIEEPIDTVTTTDPIIGEETNMPVDTNEVFLPVDPEPIILEDTTEVADPVVCSCDSLAWMDSLIAEANAGQSCLSSINRVMGTNGNTYFTTGGDYDCITGGDPGLAVDPLFPVYDCEGIIICHTGFWNSCFEMGIEFESFSNCWQKADDCDCPTTYEPVCGSNGLIYDNACLAHCDFMHDYTEGDCAPTTSHIICAGDSVYLAFEPYEPGPDDTLVVDIAYPDYPYFNEPLYTWTPATGLSCTDCENPIASPDTTTTYVLVTYDMFADDYWMPIYSYYEVIVDECPIEAQADSLITENDPITNDTSLVCNVVNPLADLDWLATIITEEFPSKIEQREYEGSTVFLVYDRNFTLNLSIETYDCAGNLLCIFAGIIDPFNPPTDPLCATIDNYINPVVIYECECLLAMAPVCGTNGFTYTNSCFADCSGVSWVEGECIAEVDTIVNADPQPIYNASSCSCDTLAFVQDIIADANAGLNCYDRILKYTDSLGNNFFGTFYDYECLTDGNPLIAVDASSPVYNCDGDIVCEHGFINTCFDNGIALINPETCWEKADDCDCPTTYEPVCGSNGLIYDNACLAQCDFIQEYSEGVCEPYHTDTICLSRGTYLQGPILPFMGAPDDLLLPADHVPYTWSPATGLSCTDCQNPYATPTETTTYLVQTYDYGSAEYWKPVYFYFEVIVEDCGTLPALDICADDPLALDWIQEYIATHQPSGIEIATLFNEQVFIIHPNPAIADMPIQVFDCEGNYICNLGGFVVPTYPVISYCSDLVDDLTDRSFIYECGCGFMYDPVCGSNGLNYINPCYAACAGVDYIEGDCNDVCYTNTPGFLGFDHELNQYFVQVLDTTGVDLNEGPVIHYIDSSLVAGIEHVSSVVFNLQNKQILCIQAADCIDSLFIEFRSLNPVECPDFDLPVCGCNEVTYFNPCHALQAGVTSYTSGPCILNTTPVAVNDTVTVESGQLINIDVLLNDYDAEGDSLILGAYTQASNGRLGFFYGKFRYRSKSNFEGVDMFTYQVCDDQGACSEGTVIINVVVPSCEEVLNYCTAPLQSLIICPEFCKLEGIKYIEFARSRNNNKLTINKGGCFTFTPSPTFTGQDYVSIRACDMNGNCQRLRIKVEVSTDCDSYINLIQLDGKTDSSPSLETELTPILEGIQIRSVYPVPAKERVNVSFQSLETGNVQINLFDITGKLIISEKLQNAAGIYDHSFDLNNFSSGLYVLQIQIGNTSVNTKFIKE